MNVDGTESDNDDGVWPRCPVCQRRRRTLCPACGVSGTLIPLADDWQDTEPLRPTREPAAPTRSNRGDPRLLLLCECCDEPFRPRFYRYCEWCGHDFGEGLEGAADPTPIGSRAIWTAIGLVAVGVGLFAWFRFVLS